MGRAILSSLHGRAAEDLRFIRATMERSATFTAVSGLAGIGMGAVGLAAAGIASMQPTGTRWLLTWLTAAVIAFSIGIVAMRQKALAAGVPLTGVTGRRFALSLSAPLASGAALTAGLALAGNWSLMPSVWLLLYGTGLVTGGILSVAVVRLLGICFMLLGLVAMLTPPSWSNVWLGAGFGVLQIAFGLYIARKHGG